MNKIKLGKVTAPQGIKGEVRVFPYTDEITRFSQIESLILEGKSVRIERLRYARTVVILKLEGIDDRNAAERIRNRELFLDKADMWRQPEDVYFIEEIVGMEVVCESGERVGKLTGVIKNSSQDLYEISTDAGKSFLLPAVKEFVRQVDMSNRRITVRLIEGLVEL